LAVSQASKPFFSTEILSKADIFQNAAPLSEAEKIFPADDRRRDVDVCRQFVDSGVKFELEEPHSAL